MQFLHRLVQLLRVYPDEEPRVGLFFLHSFMAEIAVALTQTASFALFLRSYSASLLPAVYFAVTIVAITVALVNVQLQKRLPFSTLMLGNVGLLVVSLVMFRGLLLLPGMTWVTLALPVFYRVMYGIFTFEFWGLAGRIFDVRQGKRLFALIGAGEVLALIVGGVATPPLVRLLGTPNLLVIAAVMMVGVLWLVAITLRRFTPEASGAPPPSTTDTKPQPSRWWQSRYIVLIYGAAALLVVDYLFVDYIFYAQVRLQFPNETQLASFLGLTTSSTGIITLDRYGPGDRATAQPLGAARWPRRAAAARCRGRGVGDRCPCTVAAGDVGLRPRGHDQDR